MTNLKKQIQQTPSSDFEQAYLEDIKCKGYAESLRCSLALILDNHNGNMGKITKIEGIEMIRNNHTLAELLYKHLDYLCESKYSLSKEIGALNDRMRNMEEMMFAKDSDKKE